jgi:uncharacterized protein YdeI (YjbR/CyaY-like superfamily)
MKLVIRAPDVREEAQLIGIVIQENGIVRGDDSPIGVTHEGGPGILGDERPQELRIGDLVERILTHWRQYCSEATADRPSPADAWQTGDVAEELPELLVADVKEWGEWLRTNHGREQGVWLVLAKKGTSEPTTLDYERALEEALCFGWIDGQVGRRDERTFRQRFTPRRARSRWSQRNVARIERLRAAGRMQPAGELAVEQAMADGRWDEAYAGQATMETPADFTAALAAEPKANEMWEALTKQNKYSVLYRLHDVKGAARRVQRIEQFVAMLARGETIHPQKGKAGGD